MTKPLRIGLIIYGSLDTISGGYLYDRQMVNYLRDQGDQVAIISLPWRNYGRHLADNWSRAWASRLYEISQSVDLLIQDELNHPSLFWVNRWLRRRCQVPLISMVHHLRVSEQHPLWLRPLYGQVERQYLATVDGCIYNSQTTREAVTQLLGRELPGLVAYPAADHIVTSTSTPPMLRSSVGKRESLHLLFVGNVIARKGLVTVLDALTRLTDIGLSLDVIGSLTSEPDYVKQVRQQIQVGGLADRVRLHGTQSDEQIRAFYARSDLLVVPSYEGFGIVYLEAMAHSVPVIASSHGAARGIVTHGENGYLIAPGDDERLAHLIRGLDADRALLAHMGLAAQKRFDQHPTWQESMTQIRQWLVQLRDEESR